MNAAAARAPRPQHLHRRPRPPPPSPPLHPHAKHALAPGFPPPSSPFGRLPQVVQRTASLVAAWQSVGWCHGVLNTVRQMFFNQFVLAKIICEIDPF
jgi:hypothetical protein